MLDKQKKMLTLNLEMDNTLDQLAIVSVQDAEVSQTTRYGGVAIKALVGCAATSYTIQCKSSSLDDWQQCMSPVSQTANCVLEQTHIIDGLLFGQTYDFRVEAIVGSSALYSGTSNKAIPSFADVLASISGDATITLNSLPRGQTKSIIQLGADAIVTEHQIVVHCLKIRFCNYLR